MDFFACARLPEGYSRISLWAAKLDDPEFCGQACREAQFELCSVLAFGGESGVHGAAGVYDERISGVERVREVGETGMFDSVVVPVRDHQAYPVALQATSFGRLGGF
jgi:hypothetical protein